MVGGLTKIFADAKAAAVKAADEVYASGDMQGACGFGWVIIRPGNSPAARFAKAKYGASKGWNGGVVIWNPGDYKGQRIDGTEAGAQAFARALTAAGVPGVEWGSRLD